MNTVRRYDTNFIRENSVRILKLRGVRKCEVIVDSMLSADLSGVPTHGIKMLPAYVEKFDKQEFSTENIEIEKQTNSFTKIDAKNIAGPISAMECVDIAITMAKKNGIHFVFSKNSNTFGPAFYYVEKIANKGLIGFTCSNSPASMPAMNGIQPLLGTNPFAFACPSKTKGTILIDMATSVAAKSKFLMAKSRGELIPEGWALDANGNPTTDPIKAIKGLVLPMAGPKGYGIALMIDIVAGLLSGAGYLNNVGKFYSDDGIPMNVGQMFLAIDPSQVYDGDFFSDFDNYVSKIRKSEAKVGKTVSIPGDRKFSSRSENSEKGIILDNVTVEKLELLFRDSLIEC